MFAAESITQAGGGEEAGTKAVPRPTPVPRRVDRTLLFILLGGALIRLALWGWFAGLSPHIWDEKDYNAIANTLVEHGEFGLRPGDPTSIRPPLYPALVALVYQVCGANNFQAVRLLQAVLSLVNVVVLYRLGLEVASRRVALWAAGLYCFYPSLLGFNNLILTEVLFTLLLSASCYAVVGYYKRGAIPALAVAGFLLGLAALTRSVVWVSPPLLAGLVVLTGDGKLGRRFLAAGALVLTFAVTVAPWAVRNSLLQQTFVVIDTMGGRNFMMGNYPDTPLYRSWDAISLEGERSWLHHLSQSHPLNAETTQGQIDKLAMREGLKFVRENPGLTLKRDLIKFFDFWGLERELVAGADQGYFGQVPRPATLALAVVICGSYVVVLFLAVFGMFMTPLPDRRIHWFLILVIVFVCGMHTLVFGHSRYHLPLMPLLMVYSASALAQCPPLWTRWRSASFALACGVCVLLIAGWAWNAVSGDWHLFQHAVGFGS